MRLKRRPFKLSLPPGELNVVSLMDILTTLLFFLLIVASFSRLSVVSGFGIPSLLAETEDDNRPRFVLEVILKSPTQALIWLGPTTGLTIHHSKDLSAYLSKEFKGTDSTGFTRTVTAKDAESLLGEIQAAVVPIKRSFPTQTTAVVAIQDQVSYQTLVNAVAKLSSLDKKQPAFEIVNSDGEREMTKVLFPQVIVSEWSEDNAS